MSSKPTKVYILGAGCSVCGGYPVASQVTQQLRKFANERLNHDGAKKLRRCTLETCARMEELDVQTIDQLAERLDPEEPDAIRKAKLAMSTYFFSLEEAAVALAYANYEAFFEELFHYGDSHLLEDRAKATPCRVITYNYDRLFERTFIKWAKSKEPRHEGMLTGLDRFVKKFLTMGIHDPRGITFEPDRFCFLKLHGGIGQFNRTGDYGMNHIYRPKFDASLLEFNDDSYFEKNGCETDVPTIAVPSDKKLRTRLPQDNSFRIYMDTVERQAKALCQSASEIHVIGYSVQDIDYFTFKVLIAEAKECECIVVRNKLSEKTTLMRKLKGLKDEFGAKWKLEFEGEDFFRRKPESKKANDI